MNDIEYNPKWAAPGHNCESCVISTSDVQTPVGGPVCEYHKNRQADLKAENSGEETDGNNIIFHSMTIDVDGGDSETRKKLKDALQAGLTEEFTNRSDISDRVNSIISKVIGDAEVEVTESHPPKTMSDEEISLELIKLLRSADLKQFIKEKMIMQADQILVVFASMAKVAVVLNFDDDTCAAINTASLGISELKEVLERVPVDPKNPPAPANV
jgi:hypothetical protein